MKWGVTHFSLYLMGKKFRVRMAQGQRRHCTSSEELRDTTPMKGKMWVPLVSVITTSPLDIVHVDYTSFKTTMELNKAPQTENVLVIVDHFMHYMRAYVTKDQKVETTARYLYDGYISIFGCPERIVSDHCVTSQAIS